MADDIVTDMIARARALLGPDAMTNDIAMKLESDIRRAWGGDRRHYVKKGFGNLKDRVIDEWRNNKPTAAIAAKYMISERRVRQIINGRKRQS